MKRNSPVMILSLWFLLVGQALAMSAEQKAAVIIEASPVAQKIQQSVKPGHGTLYLLVEGLTGKVGSLPTERRERRNNDIIPHIVGEGLDFHGGGSLSRIAVLLNQKGKAISVVVEKYATLSPEFIDAVSDARYMFLRRATFLGDTIDLSLFNNLERVTLSTLENVEHIKLPKSGSLKKLYIGQSTLDSVGNIKRQTQLDVLISTIKNFNGFDVLNNNQSLKFISIELSGSGLELGSLNKLEQLRLYAPSYQNVAAIHHLDSLRELSIRGMYGSEFKRVVFPSSLEVIFMFNVGKNSLPEIKNLPNLQELSFRNIEDNVLENSANLPQLVELFVAASHLPTLDGIEKFPNLVKVEINESNVNDVQAISALKHLKSLKLMHGTISDIYPITELPNVEWVKLSYNAISSLPRLRKGSHLDKLDISNNPISSIESEVLDSYSKVYKELSETPFYQSLTREQKRALYK